LHFKTPVAGSDLLTTIISGIVPTMLTLDEISSLVRQQLDQINDPALVNRMRELLVTSYPDERDWGYGHVGERFTCWTVLKHPPPRASAKQ
jgi:hypothetical protein